MFKINSFVKYTGNDDTIWCPKWDGQFGRVAGVVRSVNVYPLVAWFHHTDIGEIEVTMEYPDDCSLLGFGQDVCDPINPIEIKHKIGDTFIRTAKYGPDKVTIDHINLRFYPDMYGIKCKSGSGYFSERRFEADYKKHNKNFNHRLTSIFK